MRSIGHNVPHTDGHRDLAMVSSVTQRHVVVTVVTFRIHLLAGVMNSYYDENQIVRMFWLPLIFFLCMSVLQIMLRCIKTVLLHKNQHVHYYYGAKSRVLDIKFANCDSVILHIAYLIDYENRALVLL